MRGRVRWRVVRARPGLRVFTVWVYCAAMTHPVTPAPHTLARASDPLTSQLAAARVGELAGEHYRLVLKAMSEAGRPVGAEEVAFELRLPYQVPPLDAYQVRKRLPELKAAGLVELADGTRRTTSGRRERLWRLTGKTTS